MITLQEFSRQNRTFIVAHRGASENQFENTLEAYTDALNSHAKMIEIDVQITKDNKVIAFHNNEIFDCKSNSNIKIIDLYSYELTDVKIKNFDFNTNINEFIAHNSEENNSEIEYCDIENREVEYCINCPENLANSEKIKIPTLEEVIKLISEKAYLIIEIKSNFTENDITKADIILNEIKKYNYFEFTLFASFDVNILKRLKQIDQRTTIAVIKNPYKRVMPSEYLKILNYEVFICSIDEIDEEINSDAKSNNLFLGMYSADNLEQLIKMKDFNINAIVTNYPTKILNIIKENNLYDLNELLS